MTRECRELTFTTHDGVELFYRHWPAIGTSPGGAVVLLHRGRVLADAPAAELMDGEALPAAFLRLTGADAETLA